MAGDMRVYIDNTWPSQATAPEARVKRVAALFLLTAPNGQACASAVAGAVSKSIGSVSKIGLKKSFKQILVEDPHFVVTNTHPNEADISLNRAAFLPAGVTTNNTANQQAVAAAAALISAVWPPAVSPAVQVKNAAAMQLSTCPNLTSNLAVLAAKVDNKLGGGGIKQLGIKLPFKQLLLTEPDVFLYSDGPKSGDVTLSLPALQLRAACQSAQQQQQSVVPPHALLINAVWRNTSDPEALVKRTAALYLSSSAGYICSVSRLGQNVDKVLGGSCFKRLGVKTPFRQLLMTDADIFQFGGGREPDVTLNVEGLQRRAQLGQQQQILPPPPAVQPQQQQQQQQQQKQNLLPRSPLPRTQLLMQRQQQQPPPPPLRHAAQQQQPLQQQQQLHAAWQPHGQHAVAAMPLPDSLHALASLTAADCASADVMLVNEPKYLPADDVLLFSDDEAFGNMLQHVQAAKLVALDLEFAEADAAAAAQQQQQGLQNSFSGGSGGSAGNDKSKVGRRDRMDQLALLQLFVPSATATVTDASSSSSSSSSRNCKQLWSSTVYIVEVPDDHAAAAQLMAEFKSVLNDADIVKVMHDARQDSRVLLQFGIRLEGVLDTQVLAGLTGLAAAAGDGSSSSNDPGSSSSSSGSWDGYLGRVGLGRLYEALGFPHPTKAEMHQEFDINPRLWFSRPLPSVAIEYAANDVCYLLPATHALLQQLPAAVIQVTSLQIMLAQQGASALQLQLPLLPGYSPLMFPDRQAGSRRGGADNSSSSAMTDDMKTVVPGLTRLQFEMKTQFSAAKSGWFVSQYVVYLNDAEMSGAVGAAAAIGGAAAAGHTTLVGVTGSQAVLTAAQQELQQQQQQHHQQQQEAAAAVPAGQHIASGGDTSEAAAAAATADVDDAVLSISQLLPDRLRQDLAPYLLKTTQPQLVEITADKNKYVSLRLSDRTSVDLSYCIDVQQALDRLRVARQRWLAAGLEHEQQQPDDVGLASHPVAGSEAQDQPSRLNEFALPSLNKGRMEPASICSSSFTSITAGDTSTSETPANSSSDSAKGIVPGRSANTSMFGSDNRMGVPGTLHRISAMRDRQESIYGLTYRVGRHVPGVAMLLADVLSSMKASLDPELGIERPQSLLLLGRPGVGKTTLLRDIARLMSLTPAQGGLGLSVIIVDTSNEIAGDAEECHPCIGRARRMMVKRRAQQAEVLVQAVQNHNPDVIIVDEIGTPAEVSAARTISQRGVVLVGTAHGLTLGGLLKNPELKPLVGGVKEVTLGDSEAKASNRGQKTRLERAGAATFATLLELQAKNKWRLHLDVEQSVDALLGSSSRSSNGAGDADLAWQQQQARNQANTQLRSVDASGRMLIQFESPAAARQALSAAAAVAAAAGVANSSSNQNLLNSPSRQRGFSGGWLVDLLHAGVHQCIKTAASMCSAHHHTEAVHQ